MNATKPHKPAKILALECSLVSASAALLEDGRIVAEAPAPHESRSTQVLISALKNLFDKTGWNRADIHLTAVTTGPGSFTGVRVGLITAKTFAYAAETSILGVNTLEATAARCADAIPTGAVIEAALDAQRKQLFTASFRKTGQGELQTIRGPAIEDGAAWSRRLKEGAHVTGWGLVKWKDALPACVQLLDSDYWLPDAATVGRLAYKKFLQGHTDDLWRLSPQYLRKSAAEEKLRLSAGERPASSGRKPADSSFPR